MNIPPEQPETKRDHPTTPVANSNVTMPGFNVRYGRHGLDSIVSNEDNTQYPSLIPNDLGANSGKRKAIHQNTLSYFVPDIDEDRRNLESNIHNAVEDDVNSFESVTSDDSETFVKSLCDDPVKLRTTRTKRANKQYVQHGNENIMFVFESIKSKSVDYYKQIGDKNIMVHVNVSSNQCQLLDPNDGVIPLDTNGEVWLEIKRKSRVRGEMEGADTGTPTRKPCYPNLYADITQGTSNININLRSPTEHTDIRFNSPTENTDSQGGTLSDYLEDDGGHYSTISILEGSDDLKIKFGKYNEGSELDLENLEKSQILSHKKVLDFLSDKGNDFDVTIHDWEYKSESVYSYIPSIAVDRSQTDYYQGYDETAPENYTDLYSKPHLGVKQLLPCPTSPTKKNNRPLPKIPTQNVTDNKTSGPAVNGVCERKPTIHPRANKKTDVHKGTAARTEKTPTHLSLLEMPEENKPPPPLPLRSPTTPLPLQSPTTPLPHQCPTISLPLRSPTSPPIIDRSRDMQSDVITRRRPQKLPPPPRPTIKENLDQYKWYHGKLEQGSGKHILMNQENGSFLVRDSNHDADNHKYTIEFLDGRECKKLMIVKTDNKYHFSESNSKSFDSVVDMVNTIIDTGLEVKDTNTNSWKTIKVKPAAKYKPK